MENGQRLLVENGQIIVEPEETYESFQVKDFGNLTDGANYRYVLQFNFMVLWEFYFIAAELAENLVVIYNMLSLFWI